MSFEYAREDDARWERYLRAVNSHSYPTDLPESYISSCFADGLTPAEAVADFILESTTED